MIKNIHKNQQVLQQIEWESILHILNSKTHFESSTQSITTPVHFNKLNSVYKKTQLFIDFFLSDKFHDFTEQFVQIHRSETFKSIITAIEKSHPQSLYKLNQLIVCVEVFQKNWDTFNSLKLCKNDKTHFYNFYNKFQNKILKEFRSFVTKDGEVQFENHPLLRKLYQSKIELEQQLRQTLNFILNLNENQNIIQFKSYDVVNERYVIPVKSDSYNTKLGSIISRSDSGNTLYIEPQNIQSLNLERIQIQMEIDSIIHRLEYNYIVELNPFLSDLSKISKSILEFDCYISRARFAIDLKLNAPSLLEEKGFKISNFFHPLIDNPVKNSATLKIDQNGIIISGPNTGGKTATLKTLALIQLFIKYGLYIPAENANVHAYRNIYYFANDQQNLTEGLSSFAAEVKNYISLLASLKGSNLILIDEIFNSTSSEEASALAQAIFNKITTSSNSHIVVSTHHQTLKTLMHDDSNYISAHVGFNLEKNEPTYKLHFGAPGSSFALNIFKTLTKEISELDGLYEMSKSFLDNKVIHYEKVLASVAEKENELIKLIENNKLIEQQLRNQEASMRGVLNLKKEDEIKKLQAQISFLLEEANSILEDTRTQKIKNSNSLHNKFSEVRQKSNKLITVSSPTQNKSRSSKLSKAQKLVIGHEYFCSVLDKNVILKEILSSKKDVLVSFGKISSRVPKDKLYELNIKQSPAQKVIVNFQKTQDSNLSYDCRGMRLSEFQNLVESKMADILYGDIPFIDFIHGHGNGVLKNWLKKYIKDQPELKIDDSDDGNDGSSRIVSK